MLDVESYTRRAADGTVETIPAEQIAAAARRWIDRVQAALGRVPVVYTATFIWSSHIHSPDFAENPLWIADWHEECPRVPSPWTTWAIHQYSPGPDADHSIPGIDRAVVDHDHFNGGRAALDRFILRSFVVRDGGVADAGVADTGADDASAEDASEPVDSDASTDANPPRNDGGASDDASATESDGASPADAAVGSRVAGCSVRGPERTRSSTRSLFAYVAIAIAASALRRKQRN
jgi:lysozyme